MTDKVTLTPIGTFQNDSSASTTYNANNAAVTAAMDNTLSLNGLAPNQMQAILDMNSNQIINLPAPLTGSSPARLQDLSTITGGGTVSSLPVGGTINQVLGKNSSTNFDVSWQSLGTVGSVGLSMPADFTVTNSPVTTTGTLTATYATTPTGSGAFVKATSPTLVTPTIGAASATTINGNAITAGSGTLTLGSNTLTAGNTGTVVTSATSAGGDLTGTYPSPTIATNTVTNAKAANMAAYTIKANATGSTGSAQDITIGGLTQKASPAGTDLVLIQDQAASGALKYSPISSIATAGSVGSVNALTGALTIGSSGGSTITSSGTAITIGEPGGMVNKFRNGTMDVFQRGVSAITVTTSGAYTADGWFVLPTGASVTAQQAAGRLGLSVNSLKVTGNTSVTDVIVKQRIESFMAAPLNGQNVTVQLQVFNNTGGSITPLLTVKHPTASDNYTATTTDLTAASMTACANNAWTLCTYTFAASSSSYLGLEIAIDFGNNFSTNGKSIQLAEADIRATPNLSIGVNTVIAPPELRPVATETAICQRYFYQWNALSNNTSLCIFQALSSTSAFGAIFSFPVTMRIAPTITTTGAANFTMRFTSGTACNALDFTGTTTQVLKSDSGWTTGSAIGGTPTNGACILVFANTSAASILASAEL